MGWTYTLEQLAEILRVSPPTGAATFSGISTDTRSLQPGDAFFALKGPTFDGNAFVAKAFQAGAAFAVCNTPEQAGPCLLLPDTLQALQSFAAYHRAQQPARVIAITGSVGKTSSKDMIAAVLGSQYRVQKTRGNLNNEIGCPLTLMALDQETEFAVIEMGANHVGEIRALCELARPNESAITTIAPAHLEGFGSIENVAKAKGEIMEALGPDGTFYVNTDDPRCAAIGKRYPGRTIQYGKEGDIALESCEVTRDGMRLGIDPIGELELPLYARAHAHNVLLAVAIGLQHGIKEFDTPLREAANASTRFKVLHIGPLEVFDDTYNANPASVGAALEALAERATSGARMAALGEMRELGDTAAALHREIGERAASAGVTHLFALGEHACDTIAGARAAGVAHAEALPDHQSIAASIHRVAQPGDTLLVKGSRGVTMERVVEALAALYDPKPAE